MNVELKNKWVVALRSGAYKQGKNVLRNNLNEFCCLGVLCDIVNPDGWQDGKFEGCSLFTIPEQIREKYNMDFLTRDRTWYLQSENDSGEMNFEKIANLIEANY